MGSLPTGWDGVGGGRSGECVEYRTAEIRPQEYALGAVPAPDRNSVSDRKWLEYRIADTFSTERRIAHYLDSLNLPESAVIADAVYGFAILAASNSPKTFVVPSDPDFTGLLNAPSENGMVCWRFHPCDGERQMH